MMNSSVGQCYWQGPAFYDGRGNNQLRQMVQQRINNPEEWIGSDVHPNGINTEIVVDIRILKEMLKTDFAATISAFVATKDFAPGHNLTARQRVCQYLLPKLAEYGITECPPVIGLDPKQTSAPFFTLS